MNMNENGDIKNYETIRNDVRKMTIVDWIGLLIISEGLMVM